MFDLNQKLRIATTPVKLHDLRDNLVNDLSRFMDVKVTFQASGSALVQSKKDGTVLVSGEYYENSNIQGLCHRIIF